MGFGGRYALYFNDSICTAFIVCLDGSNLSHKFKEALQNEHFPTENLVEIVPYCFAR